MAIKQYCGFCDRIPPNCFFVENYSDPSPQIWSCKFKKHVEPSIKNFTSRSVEIFADLVIEALKHSYTEWCMFLGAMPAYTRPSYDAECRVYSCLPQRAAVNTQRRQLTFDNRWS